VEHLRHFGLARDAFGTDPVPSTFFEAPPHLAAARRLERSIAQRKGLTLLVGEAGAGKTLLLRRLLDALEDEVVDATLLVPIRGVADAGWVLSRFAQQLGVEEPAADRGALLGQVYERLAIVREDGRHAVLLVDEGHVVADPETLQQLRGLLNLEYEDRRLLSLVLVGLPELDDAVTRDVSLAGRVDARIRLKPLEPTDATAYLAARLRAAGGQPSVFAREAVARLVALSRGLPRLLNVLADNALFEAFAAGQRQAGPEHVERAARDLRLERGAGGVAPVEPPAREDPPAPAVTPVSAPEQPHRAPAEAAPSPDEASLFEDEGAAFELEPIDEDRAEGAATEFLEPDPPRDGASPATTRILSAFRDDDDASVETVLGDFGRPPAPVATPSQGPPKSEPEDEIDELFVELVEEG
jgi:general secretion pathway protein A